MGGMYTHEGIPVERETWERSLWRAAVELIADAKRVSSYGGP